MGKPAVAADVIVGSIAAELASKVAVHPLDTLKTRLQYLVLPKGDAMSAKRIPLLGDIRVGLQIMRAATRSPHHSMIEPGFTPQVPRHRLALNAARSLYRGLVPQVVGVLPIALPPGQQIALGPNGVPIGVVVHPSMYGGRGPPPGAVMVPPGTQFVMVPPGASPTNGQFVHFAPPGGGSPTAMPMMAVAPAGSPTNGQFFAPPPPPGS